MVIPTISLTQVLTFGAGVLVGAALLEALNPGPEDKSLDSRDREDEVFEDPEAEAKFEKSLGGGKEDDEKE